MRFIAEDLASSYPCYGLEIPGFDGATPPLETVEEMADVLCETADTIAPEGPLSIVGFSLGGSIAYEMARRFEQAGRTVRLVVLLDSATPSQMRPRDRNEVTQVWIRFLLDGSRPHRFMTIVHGLRRALARMREPRRARTSRIPKLGAEDPTRNSDLYGGDAMKVLWRTMLHASRLYQPEPFHRPIVLLRSALGHRLAYPHDELYAEWDMLSGGQTHTEVIPGAHMDFLRPPAAQRIAKRLRALLETPRVEVREGEDA